MTEDKSVEDLMKPRYKCIADYPYNASPIGSIIENPSKSFEKELNKYPQLFKKLEWWQERKIDDMPEYVKIIQKPEIEKFRVERFDANKHMFNTNYATLELIDYLPTTETEYNQYINQNKTKQ